MCCVFVMFCSGKLLIYQRHNRGIASVEQFFFVFLLYLCYTSGVIPKFCGGIVVEHRSNIGITKINKKMFDRCSTYVIPLGGNIVRTYISIRFY